eukprot:PhF_6_TR9699/c0_g1_i1/m.14924
MQPFEIPFSATRYDSSSPDRLRDEASVGSPTFLPEEGEDAQSPENSPTANNSDPFFADREERKRDMKQMSFAAALFEDPELADAAALPTDASNRWHRSWLHTPAVQGAILFIVIADFVLMILQLCSNTHKKLQSAIFGMSCAYVFELVGRILIIGPNQMLAGRTHTFNQIELIALPCSWATEIAILVLVYVYQPINEYSDVWKAYLVLRSLQLIRVPIVMRRRLNILKSIIRLF